MNVQFLSVEDAESSQVPKEYEAYKLHQCERKQNKIQLKQTWHFSPGLQIDGSESHTLFHCFIIFVISEYTENQV